MRRLWPIVLLGLAIWFAASGLGRLSAARRAAAAAGHAVGEIAITMLAGTAVIAPDATRAAETLARRTADAASATGVRLESRSADAPLGGFVALDVVVTGPEPAVRDFAHRLEGGPTLLRLIVARMQPFPAGVLLRARVVAPWRQ